MRLPVSHRWPVLAASSGVSPSLPPTHPAAPPTMPGISPRAGRLSMTDRALEAAWRSALCPLNGVSNGAFFAGVFGLASHGAEGTSAIYFTGSQLVDLVVSPPRYLNFPCLKV